MQIYRIEALIDQDKAVLDMATKAPNQFANINSQFELNEYIKTLNSNLKKYEKGIKYNKKRERVYSFLWNFIEKTTLFGLGLGVVCVVIFVALNLPS